MHTIKSLILLFSFLLFPNLQADTPYTPEEGSVELKKKEEKTKVKIDSNFPFALIIGDSISMGYTPIVIENLKEKQMCSYSWQQPRYNKRPAKYEFLAQ